MFPLQWTHHFHFDKLKGSGECFLFFLLRSVDNEGATWLCAWLFKNPELYWNQVQPQNVPFGDDAVMFSSVMAIWPNRKNIALKLQHDHITNWAIAAYTNKQHHCVLPWAHELSHHLPFTGLTSDNSWWDWDSMSIHLGFINSCISI